VHGTNADQPNLPRLVIPNEKWISNLQHTNKYSCDWEQVFPSHQGVGINHVEWGTDERAPHARTVPPSAAQTFGETAEKIDETQVKLKNPTPEAEKLWVFRLRLS
jgi:hypothetical protein